MCALSRINARVDAAIRRASARYASARYLFVSPSGASVAIDAVKRDADTDALAPVSGVSTARRYEFIVTRRSFDAIASLLSTTPDVSTASLFEPLRKSKIKSVDTGGKVTTYGIDIARPLQENSPDAGSVRLFVYER